jgi:hypothetical protein
MYSSFNIDQIMPILSDINIGKRVVINIIAAIKEYNDVTHEIMGELAGQTSISDEIKSKIDKNVLAMITESNLHISQNVTFKNISAKKEKLFDRLKKGFSYKYKLNDGSLVENPKMLKFEEVTIDPLHRVIGIAGTSYQLSDSTDYASSASSALSEYESSDDDSEDNDLVECFVDKMKIEVSKMLSLQAYLDVLYACLDYALQSIITDVKHYKLFDTSCLEDL